MKEILKAAGLENESVDSLLEKRGFLLVSSNNSILGKVKLRHEISVIPDEGLAISRLRVELVAEKRPNEAWIAELNVLGDLPWHKGEERKVELHIMSDEFRDYVIQASPSLLVKRGNEVFGNFEIEK